jgi:NAD-dependent SIR2 family protein deacetylase
MAREPSAKALDKLIEILGTRLGLSDDHEDSPAVVLIIGAGASLESGLPTFTDAVFREKLFDAVSKGDATFLEAAYSRVPGLVGKAAQLGRQDKAVAIKEARTDDLCALAGTLEAWRRRLIEFLSEHYAPASHETRPQLAYELIAHLIKHRLVDHVISLNFDEVLDAAMDDELGSDGYQLVLPGRLMAKQKTHVPQLVKLHGTISDSDSLRFTLAQTGLLDDAMKRTLNGMLQSLPAGRPLHVVSLGYGWADPDLCDWLSNTPRRPTSIIAVVKDVRAATAVSQKLAKVPHRTIASSAVTQNRMAATIDELLWAVWNKIEVTGRTAKSLSTMSVRVPSAARHILISHLFTSPDRSVRKWPGVYTNYSHNARFEAEVLLAAGKSKDVVTLSSLARDDRVYRHWPDQTHAEKHPLDCLDFLAPGDVADVTDVYSLKCRGKAYTGYFAKRKGVTLPLSLQKVQSLTGIKISVPVIYRGKIRRQPVAYSKFLSSLLDRVHTGAAVEIDPGRDRRTWALFRQPDQLATYKSLTDETSALFEDMRWRTLLVVAEAGNWLGKFKDVLADSNRRVFLIEASDYPAVPPVGRQAAGRDVLTIGIPWWAHNRHLTLSMENAKNPLRAIYFRRRERIPRVSPVALRRSRQDQVEVLKMFLAYVARFYEYHWFAAPHSQQIQRGYNPEAFYPALITALGPLPPELRKWQVRLDRAWALFNNAWQGRSGLAGP